MPKRRGQPKESDVVENEDQAEGVPVAPHTRRAVSQTVLSAALELLRQEAPNGLSRARLAADLQITKRTADAALVALIEDGAVLACKWAMEAGRRVKTWVYQSPPSWDESLDPEARLALEVLFSALGNGLAGAWREHLEEIQKLVEGKLPPLAVEVFNKLRSKVIIRGARRTAPPAPGVLTAVLNCLGSPRPQRLQLQYASASTGKEEELEVIPWCMLHDLFSSGAFLLCWDNHRIDPSLMRLNRIRTAIPLGPTFLTASQRKDLDTCAQYQIGGFISADVPEELQVRVTGRLWVQAYLDQAPGLPEVKVIEEDGGTVLVSFWATEYRAPARWVLQMGPDAKVLSPPGFVEFVAKRSEDTSAHYRK